MRRGAWFWMVVPALLAAPCGATNFTVGSVSGYPGERVRIPVGLRTDLAVTKFDCTVEYKSGFLDYDDVMGSAGFKVDVDIPYAGRLKLEGERSVSGDDSVNGTVATLSFTVSPGAAVGTVTKVEVPSGTVYGGGSSSNAGAGAGTVTVVSAPTPLPSGPPPTVDLGMESLDRIVPGEHAVLNYRVQVQDPSWEGVPADAYIAVVPPTGGLLFIGSRGRFYEKPNPIVRNLEIDDLDGEIDFGPMPLEYPTGVYTFYGALAWPGMNPLKTKGRITGIDDTRFELLPTPTPTPAPTPAPGP